MKEMTCSECGYTSVAAVYRCLRCGAQIRPDCAACGGCLPKNKKKHLQCRMYGGAFMPAAAAASGRDIPNHRPPTVPKEES